MSVEAMAWAFRQKLEDSQIKLILLALCDHCDDDGMCWPSHESRIDHIELDLLSFLTSLR